MEEYRLKENESGQGAPSSANSPLQMGSELEPIASGSAEEPPASLERIEAALKLVVDHLQVSGKAAQVLETEQTRIVLAAVALGISATSVLALLSLAAIMPAVSGTLLGLALAMSLIFLGSVIDLSSATSLRNAVNRAIQGRDPSHLALEPGPWFRVFQPGYWAEARRTSPDLLFYQIVRFSTVVIYTIGVLYMLWAVISLYR